MRVPKVFADAASLAGLLILVLSFPLAAAPACSEVGSVKGVSTAQKGDAIDSAAGLAAALKRANGGEVFLLASGNYGRLALKKAFSTPVTIRSASAKAPACFTELQIKGAENIVLDGLVFDYTFTEGDRSSANRFGIVQSRNITISNSVFDGGYDRGAGHGRGLRFKDSATIELRNNVFRKWWKALTGGSSTDVTISGNEFTDIRSDGMAMGAIDGLTIEANLLHNFRGVEGRKDHRDMLQIMRASNQRSTNIVIRDNIFDMGAGGYAQTIWMGGDGKDLGDPKLRHQNVLIENNMIYNAHAHGISLHGVDNLSIRKNSVIRVRRAKTGRVTIPQIKVSSDSTYVVIEQNVVGKISGYKNQRDWAILNNAMIQDTSPNGPGFYDRQFTYYATGQRNGYNEYGVRPGSIIDRLNAGSTLTKAYPTRR